DELVFAATETLREVALSGHAEAQQRGLAAWVARTGESAIVDDIGTDPRAGGAAGTLSVLEGTKVLAVPVRRARRVGAVIELADRYDGLPFDAADQQALERAAAQFADLADPDRLVREPDLVRQLLADAVRAVPAQAAALLLFGAGRQNLVFSA